MARELKGLTQKDLGNYLGISDGAVANYESGKREPNLEMVLRLADYFGVTTDWLLGREGPAEARRSLSGDGDRGIDRTRRKVLHLLDQAARKASNENLYVLARIAEMIISEETKTEK